MARKVTNYIVSLIIGILIFILIVKFIGLKELLTSFSNADPLFLILAVFIWAFTYFFRAIRWKVLLSPFKKTSLKNIYNLTIISYFTNIIAPLRAGEFVRMFLLKQKEDIEISKSSLTIVLEGFFDILTIFLLGILGLLFIGGSNSLINSIKLVGILLLVFIALILILLSIKPIIISRLAEKCISLIPIISNNLKEKLRNFSESVITGLHQLKDKKTLIYSFFWSIIIHAFTIACFYTVFLAFDYKINIFILLIANTLISITNIIPSTPGRIGTFEGVWAAMFFAAGERSKEILTIGIAAHAITVIYILAVGFFVIYKYGLINTIMKKVYGNKV